LVVRLFEPMVTAKEGTHIPQHLRRIGGAIEE
jgi:hypothetical protein